MQLLPAACLVLRLHMRWLIGGWAEAGRWRLDVRLLLKLLLPLGPGPWGPDWTRPPTRYKDLLPLLFPYWMLWLLLAPSRVLHPGKTALTLLPLLLPPTFWVVTTRTLLGGRPLLLLLLLTPV